MRKLNLKDYTVKDKVPDRLNLGQEIDIEVLYRVKDSVINLLFTRELGLNGAELVRANMLAQKIEACENEALLEEAEWQRLTMAVETFKGFGKHDVELVTRINGAEEVEVKA